MNGFFAADYGSARFGFLSACADRKYRLKQYKNEQCIVDHPVEFFTDTARVGSENAAKVLVLISGTHGVEGFCGSGCQIAATVLGLFDDLPPDVAVLMIQAINRHGFAHLRRVTEANVDLNRNCVGDFSSEAIKNFNPDYESLSHLLNPEQWSSTKPHVGFERIMDYIKQRGLERLQTVVSIGQYRHETGLFYGGAKKTWSRLTLEDIISTELRDAKNIVVVDYHSGLGQPGTGELICVEADTSKAYQRAVHFYGRRVKSTIAIGSDTKSVSADVHGSIDRLFQARNELTYVALEFGTVSILEVLEALRADNWLYQHSADCSSDLAKEIRRNMRAAFYPETEDWKQAVLHRSAQVVTRALAGLGG